MNDQDPSFSLDFPEEEIICSSMHRLSTAAHHQPLAAISPPKATAAATTGEKRHSHFSSLSSQEPSSKRANLNHAPPPSAAAGDGGYTQLSLPISFPVATRSHLARTSSGTILNPPPQETSNAIQRTVSDPNPFKKLGTPPRPQGTSNAIQRTVSDRSPFKNLGTPPRPPLARTSSGSPSCGESPTMKRLMRMKERMKEMSEWWNQVLSEGDEDDSVFDNNNSDNIPKEESEIEMENRSHEEVWVETNADGLVLNFRCPCGNGYQILISGNNCYYKLTSS